MVRPNMSPTDTKLRMSYTKEFIRLKMKSTRLTAVKLEHEIKEISATFFTFLLYCSFVDTPK